MQLLCITLMSAKLRRSEQEYEQSYQRRQKRKGSLILRDGKSIPEPNRRLEMIASSLPCESALKQEENTDESLPMTLLLFDLQDDEGY